MAGTVTKYNSDNRAIERDPTILVFEYLAETGAAKSEDAVLRSMPAGVTYLSVEIQSLIADVGSGNVTCNLKHGSTTFFSGAADLGGTINTVNDSVIGLVPAADTSAAGT